MVTAVERTFQTGARLSLAARAALLVLLLFCEKFLLSFLVDYHAVSVATGLGAFVRLLQHVSFHFAVSCSVSLVVLAYARGDSAGWASINDASRGAPLRWSWMALHVALVLPLVPLTYFLYGRPGAPLPFGAMALLWVMLAAASVAALLTALAPWPVWYRALRKPGVLWFYAAAAAAVAVGAMDWSQKLWEPTAAITFDAVWHVLAPFIPSLQADPHTLILSSSSFAVRIEEFCSGLEGAGLLLTFCSAWLVCFHREYYFPRALLLLPAALALSFTLNVLRIALLMLIGYAGFPDVAIYGFHSQAGWIAFNCAAALIAMASRRSRWLSRVADRSAPQSPAPVVAGPLARAGTAHVALSQSISAEVRESDGDAEAMAQADNPTAAYLLPLLVMLAAGMLARAVSRGFETLYVLRALGGAAVLLWYWPRRRSLDWRCSWRAPVLGVLAFAIWAIAARLLTRPESMPAALAAMSAPGRLLWIATRAATAVTVVPLAEELAFRGYLLRRIVAADFESVRFGDVGVTALVVSAVVFGVEKGVLWLPGIVVGLMYGVLLKCRGRFGEAVVAHATANALLASYVLSLAQWQLW